MKADFKELVLTATNKEAVHRLADELCATPEGMRTVIELIGHEDITVVKRAAWVFNHGGSRYPEHVPDLVPTLLPLLDRSRHPSVRRGIVSVLQYSDPHEEELGSIVDRCFRYLADPVEHTAVRSFSCDVLWRACLREPDLMSELEETAKMVLPHAKPSLRFRARKAIQRIERYRKSRK